MILFKKKWRRSKVYFNDDGEFGQQTGWLLRVPYNAIGGEDATSKKVGDYKKQACVANGWHALLIRLFGKRLTYEKPHGLDLFTLFGELYRIEDSA